MVQTILYGVQRIQPTTDNNFSINYDSNSRPESTNEVRYLIDTSLQVVPAPIHFYLPSTLSFQGILPIWVYFTDISGTAGARPIIIHASGSDKINGLSTITLNTNNSSLCVQVANTGYWFAPTTGGGSGAGVQSVTGLDTDNTDPANPVVQISVDGVTISGAGTPVSPLVALPQPPPPALVFGTTVVGAGTFLSPYNAQLLLGSNVLAGTLVVSPLGNDATAVPYDMQRHYATIQGAVAVAKSGDTVLVYAGVYTLTASIQKDGISFYFMEGAVINYDVTPFAITNENVTVKGYGEWIKLASTATTNSLLTIGNGSTATIIFEAKRVQDDKGGITFVMNGGTIYINVLEDISSVSRVTQCDFAPTVYIKAQRIIHTGVFAVYNFSGACVFRFRSGSPFTGKFYCDVDTIQSVNGNHSMFLFDCQANGVIKINYNQMITNTTTNQCLAILVPNTNLGYIEVNGDLIGNAPTSKTTAIYGVTFNLGISNFIYNGNIYLDEGLAMRVSANGQFTFTGNMYGRPQIQTPAFGSPIPPIASLVYITFEGLFGSPTSRTFIRNSTLNVFNAGTTCIYKSMLPNGAGTFNQDNYLELQNVKMFTDIGSNCIVSSVPVAPSLNTVQIEGVQSNTAVDVNTTQVGGAILVNPTLQAIYPPIL